MARLSLSQLKEWTLLDPKQDLRGLEVRLPSGEKAGTVVDLIVNTMTNAVDGVVLDTGDAFHIRALHRHDSFLALAPLE